MNIANPSADAKLRLDTVVKLIKYHNLSVEKEYNGYTLLRRVLGRGDRDVFDNFTDEDRYYCELLIGPHGYSIYKMLCIKRGINTSTFDG